jgi:RNA recognition motif-containing protein
MNIYVGNLDRQVTEDELKKTFEAFGEVTSVKIIKDMYSGESKGFAFVEMADAASGKTAMQELNGKEIKGRTIRCDEARQRTGGAGGGDKRRRFNPGGGGGNRSNSNFGGGYNSGRRGY